MEIKKYNHIVKESVYVKTISQHEVHTLPIFSSKHMEDITVIDIQGGKKLKQPVYVNVKISSNFTFCSFCCSNSGSHNGYKFICGVVTIVAIKGTVSKLKS